MEGFLVLVRCYRSYLLVHSGRYSDVIGKQQPFNTSPGGIDMISKEDQKWLEDHNVWLDKKMIEYDGYWYLGGYEWQYQYWAEDGWEELHKTTISKTCILCVLFYRGVKPL